MPDLAIDFRQTNREDELIEWVHEAIDAAAGIIINAAAYSFTSIALLNALKMFPGPIVEVHISNIHRREAHYNRSYVSLAATAVVAGLGAAGYPIPLRAIASIVSDAGGAQGMIA